MSAEPAEVYPRRAVASRLTIGTIPEGKEDVLARLLSSELRHVQAAYEDGEGFSIEIKRGPYADYIVSARFRDGWHE